MTSDTDMKSFSTQIIDHKHGSFRRLKLDAKQGAYEVDKIVGSIPLGELYSAVNFKGNAWPIGFIRSCVNDIGDETLDFERAIRSSRRKTDDAKAHFQHIKNLSDFSRVVAKLDVENAQYGFHKKSTEIENIDTFEEDMRAPGYLLEEISKIAGQIGDLISKFETEVAVTPAINTGPGRPLRIAFELSSALRWELLTDKKPGKSKDGRYTKFSDAAWLDLGFAQRRDD